MIVLGVILALLGIAFIYWLIIKIDEYTYKVYKYEFFSSVHFFVLFLANVSLYFGHMWYKTVIAASEDILNGIILMIIGALIVTFVVYVNVKRTSLLLGLSVSLFQIALYAVGSVFALFAIVVTIAFLAETKPVYNIND